MTGPLMADTANAMDLASALSVDPLHAVVHAAHEAVVMVDLAQNIVAANPAASRMFGRMAEAMVGQPLSLLIPVRHHDAHRIHVSRFAESGEAERRMGQGPHIEGRRANGEVFPAEAAISRVVITAAGHRRACFVALLRDLSQEQALQDELQRLGQRVRTLLERAPVAIWICRNGRLTFCNQAARVLFGAQSAADLMGRPVFDLLAPSSHEALRAQIADALGADDGADPASAVRGTIVRGDGQAREVEIATTSLPDHGKAVVQMIVNDITLRVQQWEEAERHRRALRELSDRLVEAREEERRRVARELHDELGQRLSALKMGLAGLKPGQDGLAAELRAMSGMVDDTVVAVRRLAADLRPLMLDDLGLNAAIETLAQDATACTDLAIDVALDPVEPVMSDRAAIAIYRMVQEALTNVGRHAHARRVQIALHRRGDDVELTVTDDGGGFSDPSARPEGRFGLLGMHERARALGGRLTVDNAPTGGGRITVRLPLSSP